MTDRSTGPATGGELPAVVVLGGSVNALSIVRSLTPRGVTVHMSMPVGRPELATRYCRNALPFDPAIGAVTAWRSLLLGAERRLDGSVLLACDDDAIEFLASHHSELAARYRLDAAKPELHLDLLDKQRTLELARTADVPVPNSWQVREAADASRVAAAANFPVIVKPLHSHRFQKVFGKGGRKFFVANQEGELRELLARVLDAGLETMVVEKCPGPDSLLGSYYTYIDGDGTSLFHYTKRIIRRFPKNEGIASYHVAEWDEEIAAMGQRFFKGIGFRGLGNVEFKRDLRDGSLRIIECNPRFTAAQELLQRCGIDTAWLVYTSVVGMPVPKIASYRQGLHYWYPLRDFRAYRELSRLGELSLFGWLGSICHRQVLPRFRLFDPMPAIRGLMRRRKP
tara:strand:+ start:12792 stop:13982 length:1191 start_codon:yes stop_codon:yes gene_type:complete